MYCNNNPVLYVDPNGEEVWIHYKDEGDKDRKMLYTANMKYKGSNSFVSAMVSNLNATYKNGGEAMLKELMKSDKKYNFVNEVNAAGDIAAFRPNKDGGNIFAGNIKDLNPQNVEIVSHELFHALQSELGQGGAAIFNEVEAFVFGATVATNYITNNGDIYGSISGMGMGNPAGAQYEKAFGYLQNKGYTNKEMVNAVTNFLGGAAVNASGRYSSFKTLPRTTHGGPVKSILSKYQIIQ